MLTPEVAELLLSTFVGRSNYIAVQPAGSNPAPKALTGPVPIDKFIEKHTNGNSCGVYFLREDNTVTMVCADFDNHDGNNPEAITDAQGFSQFLLAQGFPCYLEQSQSGTGAHVWCFFTDPIPASEARMFLIGALQDCGHFRIESYPRQSKLSPEKPLGNYVRYPLSGKSCFLDSQTLDVLDPLTTLQNIQRITPKQVAEKHWWNTAVVADKVESTEYEVTGLPSRVASLMETEKGELLLKRWMGDLAGMAGDRSNSGICLSLATEMVRNCIPTPEIEAALRYWCEMNAYDKGLRAGWIPATVRAAYSNLMEKKGQREVFTSERCGNLCHAAIEQIVSGEGLGLIPTGIPALDASLGGGFARGEYIIVAGRPSNGKSMTAWQFLDSAAKAGFPGAFVSLEMPEIEVMKRHLLRLTDIPKEEWSDPAVAAQLHELVDADLKDKASIFFTRGGAGTIGEVVQCITEYARKGAALVVVDYIGIIGGKGSDFERVSKNSVTLKKLAADLNIALVVCAQLGRQDKRIRTVVMPMLSDLRDSGQLEQDADVVLAVVWPHQISAEDYEPHIFNICHLKGRNRGIGQQKIALRFNKDRQTIS